MTVVIGVAGSELATLFGRLVGWHGSAGLIGSIIGAVVLLLAPAGPERTLPPPPRLNPLTSAAEP